MAEWLRRWTRNPMGSSREGSIPARGEIIFVLKKEIQLWKGSHPSSGSHWNDEVEHSALNWNAPAAMAEWLNSKSKGIFPPMFEACSQRDLFALQRTSFGKKALRQVVDIETTRLNKAHSTYLHQLRWPSGKGVGLEIQWNLPAQVRFLLTARPFCVKKNQLWKESNVSSGSHWNDEIEHSALNFIAPAAIAEWLRRWTRNSMGSSSAGSNPARSEIFLC